MNKAIGILVIGLGLILIAIGITGTQSQILADLKAISPKLRSATGTSSAAATTGGTSATTSSGGTTSTPNPNPNNLDLILH
jgi:hypothetical protein